jgi:rSAM/selenodomain-associated transferase 1
LDCLVENQSGFYSHPFFDVLWKAQRVYPGSYYQTEDEDNWFRIEKLFIWVANNFARMISQERFLDPARSRVQPGSCALGIMTKAPEPGRVKTRLSPPLTPNEAAELNRSFLSDIGQSIDEAGKRTCGRGVAIYTPIGKESLYDGILPESFRFVPQRGRDFGERLRFAGEDLLEIGFDSFCLINSDSPMVPASSFARAAELLGNARDRVVLGPSEDGGYYLIGLKRMHVRLFQEIEWSTDKVFAQTEQRAKEVGLEVELLPIGLDVDDCATLKTLCERLLGDVRDKIAPHTKRFLSEIIAREGRARIWSA